MSVVGARWAMREAHIPNPTPAGMPSTHTLRLVLIYVADYANDEHARSCWASVDTIATVTGLSDRQVQKCLTALRDLGLIRPGDASIVADKIHRSDRRPNVWQLCLDGANTVHPGDLNVVKSGPNGVNVVRERGESRSPKLLEELLEEQERRGEPQPKPTRAPRPRPGPLSEDWQPKIEECVARTRFDETAVRRHAERFRQWLAATGRTFVDYDARFLKWLYDERDESDRPASMFGQRALFARPGIETPEEKRARQARDRAEADERIAAQFAQRAEDDRRRAMRKTGPEERARILEICRAAGYDVERKLAQ